MAWRLPSRSRASWRRGLGGGKRPADGLGPGAGFAAMAPPAPGAAPAAWCPGKEKGGRGLLQIRPGPEDVELWHGAGRNRTHRAYRGSPS